MAVFVEAEKAARELGVRQRGGFFDDNRDEDYALALVDGAFSKALVVRLVRKVEGRQFYEVRPRPHHPCDPPLLGLLLRRLHKACMTAAFAVRRCSDVWRAGRCGQHAGGGLSHAGHAGPMGIKHGKHF